MGFVNGGWNWMTHEERKWIREKEREKKKPEGNFVICDGWFDLFFLWFCSLRRYGALDKEAVVERGEGWRLVSCTWLHAGVIHLLANMLSLLFIGVRLEQEFGFCKHSQTTHIRQCLKWVLKCLKILLVHSKSRTRNCIGLSIVSLILVLSIHFPPRRGEILLMLLLFNMNLILFHLEFLNSLSIM